MAMYNSYPQNQYPQNGRRYDDRIEFRIVEHIGVLSENENGWLKEVNLVAWNGGSPKIDIREWQPDHARMSRGINMPETEAVRLATLLSERYFGSITGRAVMAQNRPGQAQYQNGPPLMGGQPVHMMPYPAAADPAYFNGGQVYAAANGYPQANPAGGFAPPNAMGGYAQGNPANAYPQANASGGYGQPASAEGYAQADAAEDCTQQEEDDGDIPFDMSGDDPEAEE